MSFAAPHTEPISITLPGTKAVVRASRGLRTDRLVCLAVGHRPSRATFSTEGARCIRCRSRLR